MKRKLTEEEVLLIQELEEKFPAFPKNWPRRAGWLTWFIIVASLVALYLVIRNA